MTLADLAKSASDELRAGCAAVSEAEFAALNEFDPAKPITDQTGGKTQQMVVEEWKKEMHDGWFFTSDFGRIEDGRLIVEGRVDDVLICGGVNISISAVERFIQNESG